MANRKPKLIVHPAPPAAKRNRPGYTTITVEVSVEIAAQLKRHCVEPKRSLGSVVEEGLRIVLGGAYWVAPKPIDRRVPKPTIEVGPGTVEDPEDTAGEGVGA